MTTTPQDDVPTTDQLVGIAETLGFRVCPEHRGAEDDPEYTVRLLATILTMTQVHITGAIAAWDLHKGQRIVDDVFHNVGSMAGLVDCDDPFHRIDTCCGLIPIGGAG